MPLLLSTADKQIVEISRKDPFWGAVPVGPDNLVGQNVLGKLLMELREKAVLLAAGRASVSHDITGTPPDINNFMLLGGEVV